MIDGDDALKTRSSVPSALRADGCWLLPLLVLSRPPTSPRGRGPGGLRGQEGTAHGQPRVLARGTGSSGGEGSRRRPGAGPGGRVGLRGDGELALTSSVPGPGPRRWRRHSQSASPPGAGLHQPRPALSVDEDAGVAGLSAVSRVWLAGRVCAQVWGTLNTLSPASWSWRLGRRLGRERAAPGLGGGQGTSSLAWRHGLSRVSAGCRLSPVLSEPLRRQ